MKPDDVSDEVWEDFLIHRKAKRATVTNTVLKRIRSEADKAGWTMEEALSEMCLRGWQGFRADWVNKDVSGGDKVSKAEYIKAMKNQQLSGWPQFSHSADIIRRYREQTGQN